MRVLVTGGAGFIGSHVVDRLIADGHRVTVLDNLSQGRREWVDAAARLVIGDIRHPDRFRHDLEPVDAMIHLAAQVSVPAGESAPLEDGSTNVMGTLKMLVLADELGAREFRFASSAAVYGAPDLVPIPETAPIRPQSFYGAHKYAAEWDVRHFCEDRRIRPVVLRLANVYGPRQRAEGEGAVVAAFCQAAAGGKTPVIHGDGGQSRDFVFVGDVARAFAHDLGGGGEGITVNVGYGQQTTILALWKIIAAMAGRDPDAVRRGPNRPGDVRESLLDITRARTAFGFEARTGLREGIRATLADFAASGREAE